MSAMTSVVSVCQIYPTICLFNLNPHSFLTLLQLFLHMDMSRCTPSIRIVSRLMHASPVSSLITKYAFCAHTRITAPTFFSFPFPLTFLFSYTQRPLPSPALSPPVHRLVCLSANIS